MHPRKNRANEQQRIKTERIIFKFTGNHTIDNNKRSDEYDWENESKNDSCFDYDCHDRRHGIRRDTVALRKLQMSL